MTNQTQQFAVCAILSALAFFGTANTAAAHPHVWVTYEMTVTYEQGAATGVEHIWTFDDMYTTMAVEGLDKNKDGIYDRAELEELAKVNMDGLKEFGYFTTAKLGGQDLAFSAPVDAWLEHKNGLLKLRFRLPLAKPVLADAPGLNFAVYDPSFFIAFEPEATNAIHLAKAPEGCTATLTDPASDKADADAAKLGAALAQELGADASANASLGGYKTVSITCVKS